MVDHPPVVGSAAEAVKADEAGQEKERRVILIRCGRFAVVTPPMMTTLLAVSSIPSEANASTIGRSPGKGRKGRPGFPFSLLDD